MKSANVTFMMYNVCHSYLFTVGILVENYCITLDFTWLHGELLGYIDQTCKILCVVYVICRSPR